MARHPGAQQIVRIKIETVFSNCPRCVHKMQLVEEFAYVTEVAEIACPGMEKAHCHC